MSHERRSINIKIPLTGGESIIGFGVGCFVGPDKKKLSLKVYFYFEFLRNSATETGTLPMILLHSNCITNVGC